MGMEKISLYANTIPNRNEYTGIAFKLRKKTVWKKWNFVENDQKLRRKFVYKKKMLVFYPFLDKL